MRTALDSTRERLAKEKPAVAYLIAWTAMRDAAQAHGYALAVHGSLNRDFDIVAVPWTDEATDADTLVAAITHDTGLKAIDGGSTKPHGRRAWTLVAPRLPGWVDLSVMPRITTPSPE